MPSNENIPFLLAEIAEINQLIDELGPDAISTNWTLQKRKNKLENELHHLANSPETAAFVELLFNGSPVLDSRAIDASFGAKAVLGYQGIINQSTAVRQGGLGSRGNLSNAATASSKFLISGVARGSFGFVLEENIETRSSLFDTTLKEAVTDVSNKMSSFCNDTDADYNLFIETIDKRLFYSFKHFFKLLHNARAEMKIISRSEGMIFSLDNIERAFVRTEKTSVYDDERRVTGILTGLAEGTFNFLSSNQTPFAGKLAPTFGLEYQNQVERTEFDYQLGKRYSAQVIRRTTKKGAANPHIVFFLVGLLEADNPSNPDTDWHRI